MKTHSLVNNKKRLLFISVPIILTVFYLMLLFYSAPKHQPPQNGESLIFPTRFIAHLTPSPKQANPAINYIATEKMMDRVQNRVPLGLSDQKAEERLLASVKKQSAILHSTAHFRVEYIHTPHVFMVEITTQDIMKAKKEAKAWFLSKEFSPLALCEMPVIFYVSWSISEQLRPLRLNISPLADGC